MRDISFVRMLPIEPRVPFLSARRIAAALSVLAIIASIFLFATKNLNYGIDFTGGTVLEIDTGSSPTTEDISEIRGLLGSLNLGSGVGLQTIAASGDNSNEYLRITLPIQEETIERENELLNSMLGALETLEGDNFVVESNETNERGFTTIVVKHGDDKLANEVVTSTDSETAEEGVEFINSNSNDPRLDDVETIITSMGLNIADFKRLGDPEDKRVEIRFEQKKEASAAVQQLALGYAKLSLAQKTGDYTIRSQGVLGSKVSGELRRKGIMAVVLALGMVLLYIWFRFEWQFALGAVVALFHDVILTIGVFSLTQLEFNLSIIAAILTIVGYSLNDTVIVYDRIRENMRKYKKKPMAELINLSINDTLSRTIMTSLTTLLALVALYILGGEGLRGFSFAMIWGVFVGTYSSIFVASPLLLLFKLRNVRSSEAAEAIS